MSEERLLQGYLVKKNTTKLKAIKHKTKIVNTITYSVLFCSKNEQKKINLVLKINRESVVYLSAPGIEPAYIEYALY